VATLCQGDNPEKDNRSEGASVSEADPDQPSPPPEPVTQPSAEETIPSEPPGPSPPGPAEASPFPAPEMEDFLGSDDPVSDGNLLRDED
jgi:hypothetical protein